MLRVELRAVRARSIGEIVVFHLDSLFRAADLPSGFIKSSEGKSLAPSIVSAQRADVFSKVAHLVERVPHRELELVLRHSNRQAYSHMQNVGVRIAEIQVIGDRRWLRGARCA